jgi:Uma2 family endonuclease
MRRSSAARPILESPGQLRAEQISPGSRYELRDGHAVYCAPTGGDGARATIEGAQVLNTDPAVEEAGIDAGYSWGPGNLRAPDIAVGDVPDEPGWIAGIPPLAVEYAGVGQEEDDLQKKIEAMILTGTRWVWVVRLTGERRVEVHQKGKPPRTLKPGAELRAPGVLKNAIPVEALFDRDASRRATLKNLLQREGYESLEAVRDAGRIEARAASLLDVLAARGIDVPEGVRARITACRDGVQVEAWMQRARVAHRLADVLGE